MNEHDDQGPSGRGVGVEVLPHTASWTDRGFGTALAGGPMQAGYFVRGLQDGSWTRHHASGELLDRGVCAAGRKIGEWVAFDPTGKPERTTKHREPRAVPVTDPATERRKPCLFQVGAASARARRAIGMR
jgi:hypothetical protein